MIGSVFGSIIRTFVRHLIKKKNMLHILNKRTNNPNFNPLLYWLHLELDKHEIRI